jgi:hypothetical protein
LMMATQVAGALLGACGGRYEELGLDIALAIAGGFAETTVHVVGSAAEEGENAGERVVQGHGQGF